MTDLEPMSSRAPADAATASPERIIIVGAGLAGLRAAERLRELNFTGELVILGAERHQPYHRPALSKQLLLGELRPSDLLFESYVDLDAQWRLNTPVYQVDTSRRMVHLPGGEEMRYDGLVIATGVEPRHLAGSPRHDPRVVQLRTLDDAAQLRRQLRTGDGPVVVIGGGFTACEVASTVRQLGRAATIASRSPVLMGRALGKKLGMSLAELHRANGVDVHLGVKVLNWFRESWGMALHLSDGHLVLADCVVLAVGSVPSTAWLRGSGLALEDGVLCAPTCHAVGATDVVAAGDVARWPNLRFDSQPRRVEHWLNAVEMGRHAAESLLAGQRSARPYTPLPRFWTEQHKTRLQGSGLPALADDTVRLAGMAEDGGGGLVGYVQGGRLVGVVGRESPRAMVRWTAELEEQLRRTATRTPERERVTTSYRIAERASGPLRNPAAERASGPLRNPAAERSSGALRPVAAERGARYLRAVDNERSSPNLRAVGAERSGPVPRGADPGPGSEREMPPVNRTRLAAWELTRERARAMN
jgi:NADPH-dependent 2,4-dienoyl-CoA reductase/sulfur reductase-like enzyme